MLNLRQDPPWIRRQDPPRIGRLGRHVHRMEAGPVGPCTCAAVHVPGLARGAIRAGRDACAVSGGDQARAVSGGDQARAVVTIYMK